MRAERGFSGGQEGSAATIEQASPADAGAAEEAVARSRSKGLRRRRLLGTIAPRLASAEHPEAGAARSSDHLHDDRTKLLAGEFARLRLPDRRLRSPSSQDGSCRGGRTRWRQHQGCLENVWHNYSTRGAEKATRKVLSKLSRAKHNDANATSPRRSNLNQVEIRLDTHRELQGAARGLCEPFRLMRLI